MPPETPQNGEYLVAAYVITTVILLGYWLALWRRAKKTVSGKKRSLPLTLFSSRLRLPSPQFSPSSSAEA